VELCLAASSRLVMDVTSRLDAARHGLRLGASEASRNAAVYQWAERSACSKNENNIMSPKENEMKIVCTRKSGEQIDFDLSRGQ
jgi:hypothetical protein